MQTLSPTTRPLAARSLARLLFLILLLAASCGARPVQAQQPDAVQAGLPLAQEWVQTGAVETGSVQDAQFARVTAVNTDGSVIVVGAGSETVGGKANQGTVYVRRMLNGSSNNTTLNASDGLAGDHFGAAVAVSADGNTILVGAYQAKIGANTKEGAAYVFTWTGSVWLQLGKLTPSSGAASLFFGSAVALNADGSTALVGANGYSASQTNQGAAYVFTRVTNTWVQQGSGPLTEFDAAASDFMGSAVALSADGNTALVSSPGKASNLGAAYVFLRSGASWAYQRKFLAWDGVAGDDFGRSVALSSDGNTALIGADNASVDGKAFAGTAYTYHRTGASWANGAKLTDARVAESDWFGYAVSLSADGSIALIGAPLTKLNVAPGSSGEGAAYIFSGTGLGQSQRLAASNGAPSDLFGSSASLAGDGSLAVLGAPNLSWGTLHQGGWYHFPRYAHPWTEQLFVDNASGLQNDWLGTALALSSDGRTALVGSVNMNEVFVYSRSNGSWSLQATIPSNDPTSQDFGAAVALSGDGNTALVGAWSAGSGGLSRSGAAYLMTRTGATWSDPQQILAPDIAQNLEFGQAVALSSDGSTAAIGAPNSNGKKGGVYVMLKSAGTWSAPVRYEASDPLAYAYFGTALALSADGGTLLVGAGGASNGTTTTGAAYVLVRSGTTYSEQKKLFPLSNYADSNYGDTVALSADGNTAVIGSPYWGSGSLNGLFYTYTRSGTVWTGPSGGFSAPDYTEEDLFGSGVALSADGTRLAVGASRANANGTPFQGAVYLYNYTASGWALQAKLMPPEAVQAEADGEAVVFSGDGHTLLFNTNGRNNFRGGMYFYSDIPSYGLFLPVSMR